MAVAQSESTGPIGASLEGVFEALSDRGRERSRGLQFVIAPGARGEAILSGDAALRSREGLGLPWPPWAQVSQAQDLRRVPVPVLWRGLTQQRDGRAEWEQNRVKTRFADLLAAHVTSAIGSASWRRSLVLGVPDGLSTFSQQSILDALRRSGVGDVRLLWNPIALALAWLQEVGSNLHIQSETDALLVLNLGPGAIDCVAFQLRETNSPNGRWIAPVRRPGGVSTSVDAFDLVSVWIESSMKNAGLQMDLQALWYGLGIDECWGGQPLSVDTRSPIWSRQGAWEHFPSALLEDTLTPDFMVTPPPQLDELLRRHGAPHRKNLSNRTWRTLLFELIDSAVGGRSLRGVIVSGLPFALGERRWIRAIEEACRNLEVAATRSQPCVDRIWNAGSGGSAIARGAELFGRRSDAELPTYFDSLPQLDIYAATAGGGIWVPIVRDTEVVGGNTYHHEVKGEFALAKGQSELEAYLRMRDEDRESIRLTTFRFPRGPSKQMPLDLTVEVRPAGGLALVEMVPTKVDFLGGMHVYLDYDEMEEVDELPEFKLGWPSVVDPHHVDPEDAILLTGNLNAAIERFLLTDYDDPQYPTVLDSLKSKLQRVTFRNVPGGGRPIQYRAWDIAGRASTERGRALVATLSERIDRDFRTATAPPTRNDAIRNKLVTAGGWLFGAAPDSIREFARVNLGLIQSIHFAGRVFSEPDEVELFFAALEKTAWQNENALRWITIPWLWSAKRILSAHERAADSLDREQVVQLYYFLFDDLLSWIVNEQVNGFVATLWLLLYLLRYRVREPRFLAPNSDHDEKLSNGFDTAIAQAESQIVDRRGFLKYSRRQVALEILSGIREFREFRGSMNIVTKLAGLEGDDG